VAQLKALGSQALEGTLPSGTRRLRHAADPPKNRLPGRQDDQVDGFRSGEPTQSRHNMSSFGEWIQVLLDHVATGQLRARDFLMGVSAAGVCTENSNAHVVMVKPVEDRI
jgi:hypothetical protein